MPLMRPLPSGCGRSLTLVLGAFWLPFFMGFLRAGRQTAAVEGLVSWRSALGQRAKRLR
jgi:hypothetical protein